MSSAKILPRMQSFKNKLTLSYIFSLWHLCYIQKIEVTLKNVWLSIYQIMLLHRVFNVHNFRLTFSEFETYLGSQSLQSKIIFHKFPRFFFLTLLFFLQNRQVS